MQGSDEEGKDSLGIEIGKGIKKGSYQFISSQRKVRENTGLQWNHVGVLVIENTKKVELLNAFLGSAFTAEAGPQGPLS